MSPKTAHDHLSTDRRTLYRLRKRFRMTCPRDLFAEGRNGWSLAGARFDAGESYVRGE